MVLSPLHGIDRRATDESVNELPSASADPRIQKALEGVYARFASPTPRVIEGCPCCIGTRGVDVLLRTPLRQVTGAMLWRYTTGAFLTVGAEKDFRYLLPRMLDLAVNEPAEMPDLQIILGKLTLAHWTKWSAAERQAIEALLDPWFDHLLARDLYYAVDGFCGTETEAFLCGTARAGLDIEPWLVQVSTPAAEPLRAGLIERYARELALGRSPNLSFWDDAPRGWRALAAMLSTGDADHPVSARPTTT